MASINLSFSSHFNFLADSLFTQASESPPEYDVRIHCSDGRIVRANRQLLCLGFHLFREIFGSDCSCVTYLPVVYDVVCSEFSSGVLWKVLKSFITGQVGTDSFEESEIDEVQSILKTFKIAVPFQIEPLNNSGSRQEEEHVDEIIEGLQAFRSRSSVSRNERQPLDVSITIKVEDDIVCNDTEDGELNNSGPRINEAPTEDKIREKLEILLKDLEERRNKKRDACLKDATYYDERRSQSRRSYDYGRERSRELDRTRSRELDRRRDYDRDYDRDRRYRRSRSRDSRSRSRERRRRHRSRSREHKKKKRSRSKSRDSSRRHRSKRDSRSKSRHSPSPDGDGYY